MIEGDIFILFGTVVFTIGGLMAAYGWNIKSSEDAREIIKGLRNPLAKVYIFISLGTILIAAGGLSATYGWNVRSSEDTRKMLMEERKQDLKSRRDNLSRVVAAEAIRNIQILDNRPYTETEGDKLSRFVPYPRLQTSAVTGAIASGIFSAGDDIELFTLILSSYEALHDINSRLDRSEDLILVKPEMTKEFRIKISAEKPGRRVRSIFLAPSLF